MTEIRFTVPGVAAPQGSKTRTRNGGIREDNPRTRPWRDTVTHHALQHRNGPPILGPVLLALTLELPRPKAHYRTGKHAGELKATAPRWVTTTPDSDKCARAIADAITDAQLIRDDAQIAYLQVLKRYAPDRPQVYVLIRTLEDTNQCLRP